MATTTQETRDALRSLIQKVTIMVADLQTINDEQQDLIYKIEVMVGIRSVSVQPSPLPQPSVLLELPPPSPPAEVVAPTDLPPELLPTQPSVQSYALPSTAATPAPVMPVHAASLRFAPMSSPAPQSSGLLKQPTVASASISTMLAPPLASLTLQLPPATPQVAHVAFGLCSHGGGTHWTVKEGNQNHSCLFPWEPGGISVHVKIGSYKEYAACRGSNLP
jgi:hypothetical protein